jgi:hypothetical protein
MTRRSQILESRSVLSIKQDYPYDTNNDPDYKAYQIDMDISNMFVRAINTNQSGNNKHNVEPWTNFLPIDEWEKMTQDQNDKLICNAGYKESSQTKLQAKLNDVGDLLNIDDIIDYTINTHEVETLEIDDENKESDTSKDVLLPHMAGHGSSYGDIQNVLAANHKPEKNKSRKANENESSSSTLQVNDTT